MDATPWTPLSMINRTPGRRTLLSEMSEKKSPSAGVWNRVDTKIRGCQGWMGWYNLFAFEGMEFRCTGMEGRLWQRVMKNSVKERRRYEAECTCDNCHKVGCQSGLQ